MKITKHISLHRFLHAAAAVLAMPLLMGADGQGCASGGHVPVGNEVCGPRDCDGRDVLNDAKLCADGTAVGRSVCATHDDGSCFWDFPACPASPDAGTKVCGPRDCDGLGAIAVAKVCGDGSTAPRECATHDDGSCFWGFAACPASPDAGAPPPTGSACRSSGGTCLIGGGPGCPSRAPAAIDDCNPSHNPGGAVCCLGAASCTPASCAGLPVPDDGKVCSDGTTLGRTVCVKSSGADVAGSAACKWDFPACPTPEPGPQACRPIDCAGLDAQLDARVCNDGSTVGRSECSLTAPADTSQPRVCGWNFPPCPGEECALARCAGLPAPGDAKLCPDGSAVSRSRCTRTAQLDAAGGYVCAWDFPSCPVAPDAGR